MDKRSLKSFSRLDGSGRIIPGSTVLRIKKPKNGKWIEDQTFKCCNDVTLIFTVGSPTITNVALRLFCNDTLIGIPMQTHVNTTTNGGILIALNNAFSTLGVFSNVGALFTLILNVDQKNSLCPAGTITMTIAAT